MRSCLDTDIDPKLLYLDSITSEEGHDCFTTTPSCVYQSNNPSSQCIMWCARLTATLQFLQKSLLDTAKRTGKKAINWYLMFMDKKYD